MPNKIQDIRTKIHTIRGVKVMLDRDLATLYRVKTEALNQGVKRNIERFPDDFMFKLDQREFDFLRSQNVISKVGRGGLRYMPSVFTEQGIAMLSGILKSPIAVEVNIRIMRTFVEIRQAISIQPEYRQLKDKVRHIELQMENFSANNIVDGAILERKITTMSADIKRISETLDNFQENYVVIKRLDEDVNQG